MGFGNRLKHILYEKKVSVKDLAKEIGVPATTLYSLIQRDADNPKFELVINICSALGLHLSDLLTDEPESPEWYNLFSGITSQYREKTIDKLTKEIAANYLSDTNTADTDLRIIELHHSFNKLNNDGKKEAIKRVSELTEIPRYTAPDSSDQEGE